jgi:hypothetical protein
MRLAAEARALGFRAHELDARLALAEAGAGGPDAARRDLAALAAEADAAGFRLHARRARELSARR